MSNMTFGDWMLAALAFWCVNLGMKILADWVGSWWGAKDQYDMLKEIAEDVRELNIADKSRQRLRDEKRRIKYRPHD
jgi:hypothetical protein